MTEPDRIAEMFGSLTEQSPGVYTSPVGLSADELTKMAETMTSEMNRQQVDPGPDPNFPDRPDHPDFRELSRIVQEIDELGSKGWEFVGIPGGMDAESVTYMARQRVLRAQELLTDATDWDRLAILWIDAFTAGARFAFSKAPSVRTVLDNSIENGSHRSGGLR